MSTTALVTHQSFFWHDAGIVCIPNVLEPIAHVDGPLPKRRLLSLIEVAPPVGNLIRITASEARLSDLGRVHSKEYIERVIALSDEVGGDVGEFCHVGPGSFEIAKLAAGAVLVAAKSVMCGDATNAFALVRPSGHHAEPSAGRGYCIFHNIAVSAEWVRSELGVSRIAIVDWDVHHGNGAQGLYWNRPDVLTISLHQDGLYPLDSGSALEVGAGAGVGYNLNVPLLPGSGSGAYEYAFSQIVEPAVRRFAPELIYIACGFDASMLDPLGRMMITAEGFFRLTGRMVDLANEVCSGRLVVATEGGYSEVYVPLCGVFTLAAMMCSEAPMADPYASSRGPNLYDGLQSFQRNHVDSVRGYLAGKSELVT